MAKLSSRTTAHKKHRIPLVRSTDHVAASITNNGFLSKNKNIYFLLSALIIITFGLYAATLHHEILNFDDNEYFNNYPEITSFSWQSIRAYFTHYYVIMYQPLAILTLAINYYFSQSDTILLHLTNIILHLINVLLVYTFIYKLSNQRFVALVSAAIFAIHPMNVEAITWISARSSSLYTLFYLLSIIFYIRYLELRQKKHLFFVGFTFILALFSKAQAVTLPMVLLVVDYYFCRINKGNLRSIFIEKTPFFLLSLLFGFITILNQDTMSNINNSMMGSYTFPQAICCACYSFIFYLYKFFVPIHLCAIYVYPPKVDGILPPLYYLSPLMLCTISYLVYFVAQRRKYIIFGALIFLITISINIQIIPSRPYIVTDRYCYFPYIGLFFIVGSFYNELLEKNTVHINCKQGLFGVLSVYLLICGLLTVQRNTVWKDNIIFTTDIINKNPVQPYISRAYGTRAIALQQNGQFEQALTDYEKAINIYPDDVTSHLNRALLYIDMHEFHAAIHDLSHIIKLQPKAALFYVKRGTAKYAMQDSKGALRDFDKAIKLDPDNIDAYNLRAIIRFSYSDYKGAEIDFSKAIQLQPHNAVLYKNRGIMLLKTKQEKLACSDFTISSKMGNKEAISMVQQYCS